MGRWIHRKHHNGQNGDTGSTISGDDGGQTVLVDTTPETRPDGARRNVFISFHSEDEAQVNLLRSQAKNENLDFRDYSVKEPFDEKWKAQCRERIAQTSATIVMIGPDTANRDAVNWEIEESYRQGKKVIGVRIYRDRNDPVPEAMKENKAAITTWDTENVQKHLDEP
jgi:Thoeris protein ThsB, TIR-like domain